MGRDGCEDKQPQGGWPSEERCHECDAPSNEGDEDLLDCLGHLTDHVGPSFEGRDDSGDGLSPDNSLEHGRWCDMGDDSSRSGQDEPEGPSLDPQAMCEAADALPPGVTASMVHAAVEILGRDAFSRRRRKALRRLGFDRGYVDFMMKMR